MVALAVVAACGGAPRGPAASTRAAVTHAEELERARRHDEARVAYEQAIADAPDQVSEVYARLELASQLAFWRDLPAAIAQLEAVVVLDDRSARAWHDLGILRHASGDDAGARAALDRAITLAPRDPRPRIALAALLWDRGELGGARTQYRALLELELSDAVRAKVEWALTQLPQD